MELDACWYEDPEWRGWIMADSPQALLARHVFMTFIAGVDHRLHAAQDATFGLGEPLVLIPEPDNPFDPDALGVWNADRTL
ncbi:MAG TPA: hypothetical protein VNN79_17200, partial [Actinomycetota bacterium]|nr:hypothetical protein [Actinomycetota bacterium]